MHEGFCHHRPWLWGLLGVALLGLILCFFPWNQWKERAIFQTLKESKEPPFWWPPGWRDEFSNSILLEGTLKPSTAATLELVSLKGNQGFRTAVSGGRYSFLPQTLPADSFRARVLYLDGSSSRWLETGPLDPGRHRLNLAF